MNHTYILNVINVFLLVGEWVQLIVGVFHSTEQVICLALYYLVVFFVCFLIIFCLMWLLLAFLIYHLHLFFLLFLFSSYTLRYQPLFMNHQVHIIHIWQQRTESNSLIPHCLHGVYEMSKYRCSFLVVYLYWFLISTFYARVGAFVKPFSLCPYQSR